MKVAMVRSWLLPCLFAVAALFRGAVAADVPQPLDLGTKDVSVFIAIPNLTATVDNVDAIVREFNPQQPPGALKMGLGFLLGDPTLANLDTSKPIVAMLFKTPPSDSPSGPPPFAIFIPAKAAQPFDQAFTSKKLVTAYANGVLIVAQNADELTKAQGQVDAYGKIADAKLKGDLRLFLNVGNLMDSYGPVIQKGMDLVTQQMQMFGGSTQAGGMDPKALAKLAALEMKIFAESMNEIDSVQLDLKLKADQVALETLLSAKKESPLASLFSSPVTGVNKTLTLLTKGGSLVGGGHINPDGYKKCADKLFSLIGKDADLAEYNTKDIQDLISGAAAQMGGDFAFSMDGAPTGGFTMESAMSIKDEKKYAEYLDLMVKLMGPDGAIGKLYGNMGMKPEVSLQKSVRQHAGVDVQRIRIAFDTSKMPPAQAAQMKNMQHDADVALVKGMYLTSYDPAELDKLIDKALAAEPKPDVSLESITAFGEGKQMYWDVDLLGFVKSVMATVPGNPATALFSQLKTKAPVVMAGNYADGRMSTEVRVPLAPFVELSTLTRKARNAGGAGNGGGQGQSNGGDGGKKDDKF